MLKGQTSIKSGSLQPAGDALSALFPLPASHSLLFTTQGDVYSMTGQCHFGIAQVARRSPAAAPKDGGNHHSLVGPKCVATSARNKDCLRSRRGKDADKEITLPGALRVYGWPHTWQLRRHFSSMKPGPVWMQPSPSAQARQPTSSSKQVGSADTFCAGCNKPGAVSLPAGIRNHKVCLNPSQV